jgi:predicted XRE-type DNA-binding protein
MNDEFELVRGSGNVFRDLNLPNPELEQLRSHLAAEIIKTLDTRRLSVREAEAQTGTPYADFSRIRNAKLDRFTVDKLMTILGRLDQQVSISVEVHPRPGSAAAMHPNLI